MSEKVGWLPLVGAILLFLALIGLIIIFRRSRTVILPTTRKWEIHRQVQLKGGEYGQSQESFIVDRR